MTKQPDVNCKDEILIVDDTKVNLDFLMIILRDAGYKVHPASNGPSALEIVKTVHPTLILIDVMMPGMDGFEVCRHLKDDENTRQIPVIFISGQDDADMKIKGFEAGGIDFISKPFNSGEVLARVKMHIELRQTRINLEIQNARLQEEIASRIKVQQSLEESEKRFRLMFENAPLSYQSLDTNARIIDVNQCWLTTLGYTRDEVIGHFFGDFMTPESAELIKARFANFVSSGEIHNYEFEMVQKNGTKFLVNYDGRIGYDELGHFNKTHCIFTDITERRQSADALRKSEEAYRQISSAVSDYIFSSDIDKDGKSTMQWVAGAFERITGYNYEEYISCGGWHARLYPDDIEIDNTDMEKLRSNQKISSEVRTFKKDGSVVWVKVYANPIMNPDKTELIGVKGAVQDIMERKLAEEKLLKLMNELEFTVAEKTKELKERVAELERFYDATIDREFRMKELRDEIELLKSGK